MKASEILGTLPKWANATADDIVKSPAWAMPCRLGETACTMRLDANHPADALDVVIMLEDERHVLSLVDSPRFESLHALWATRAEVPEQILLALVERECGPLLQLLENAARRQLKVVGIASDEEAGGERLCARICAAGEDELLSFAVTSSPALVGMLGRLAFIDVTHPSVRGEQVPAVVELAAFSLSEADRSSLAVGDALVLPEIGTVPPRMIVDGRLLVDEKGVAPYVDDGRLRVLDAESRMVALGRILDQASSPVESAAASPSQLRLVASGKDVAHGRLERLAEQPVFMVEALP